MQTEKSIGESLNVSDEENVFKYTAHLYATVDKHSEVIKRIMCSELDSKQAMLACFFYGKMCGIVFAHKQAGEIVSDILAQMSSTK